MSPRRCPARSARSRRGYVDVSIAANAVQRRSWLPLPRCRANFLGCPRWGGPYGLAGKAITRFYLADVRYGGQRHQFIAAIEATNKASLNAFLPKARKVLATVRVPVTTG